MQQPAFSWSYPLQLWLITVLGTPLLFFLWELIGRAGANWDLSLGIVMLMMVLGFFLSFPALIVLLVFFHALRRSEVSPWVVKIVVMLVSATGLLITFSLIEDSLISTFGWTYTITLVAVGSILVLPRVKQSSHLDDLDDIDAL